jgi:hypothetical protein
MTRFLPFAIALFAATLPTPARGEAAAASSQTSGLRPSLASAPVGPHAATLFERDWVLANWALKKFDSDRDILLSKNETAAAAAEFRRIADGDGDGRVTPSEYRAAREFILARY